MNNNLILEAILLPFFWLFSYLFTSAVGFAFIPFKNQKGALSYNLFTWFWYGFGITIAILQIWNLFFPINIYTWICISPIAMFGGLNLLRSGLFRFEKRGWIVSILLVLILIFLIYASLDNKFIYDSLVYHFYTIKWLNNYAITPGMGNLFTYLGLNQSYFLYPAFLNGIWGSYRGACLTNGLLAIVICSEIVLSNANYFFLKKRLTFSAIFQLLFLPLCINVGVQNLSSPTPDVFVDILTFKILSDIISCVESKKICFQDTFILAFYCAIGVCVKLSFLGISLGVLVVIIFWLISENLWKRNLLIKAVGLIFILLISWVIRGIISSGYIGFPVSLFGIPVDWKMPKSTLVDLAAFIKGFARSHLHGQAGINAAYNYNWLPGWIARMVSTVGFILPVLSFLVIILLLKIKKINRSVLFFVLIPVVTSIIFWFFTAPDIRFAVFTFWALGLASAAYFISHAKIKWIDDRAILTFIFLCCILIMIKNWNTDPEPLGDLPKQNKSVFVTKSGLKINTIKNTPPGDDWRICDCTIPCSVLPDSNIVLRGTNIREGFKIN